MRAVIIESFGAPSGLTVAERPEPALEPGQLLIETQAIGVGGVDAVIRRGTIGGMSFGPHYIPGSEAAGLVIDVGDGVDESLVGERVWAFTGVGGAYAERVVAALDDVTVLPAHLSMIDAVALGSAAPVAHFALAHARFASGESVLVRGAAGSIGIMAVQLAAAGGASTVAVTTSSTERGERLRSLGAALVLDRSGRATQAVPTVGDSSDTAVDAAAEFDIVLDIVGGADLPNFFDRLAPNGRLVSVGVVAGYPPADFGMSLMRAFQRSLSFSTFSLNTVPVADRNRVRADQFAAAARGDLAAVVHDVLPLSDAAEAHRRMDAGEVFGRIVLTP